MMSDDFNINQSKTTKEDTEDQDMEQLLEKRGRIDSLLQKKYTKYITVMFTDLKGSTSLADLEGDIAVRLIISEHLKIVLPIIEKYRGKHVKTMGDGTLSYFETAQDAVHAAVDIQKNIEEYNIKKPVIPIRLRIGLHTGNCLIDEKDIIGDVVNIASRFESIANPGTIFLSEDTYRELSDKSDIYCRFIKTALLKGKKDAFKVFEALWDKKEIENDTSCPHLDIQWKDHTREIIPINKKGILLGRSEKCDVIIQDKYVSRQHARILFENGCYFIEDLKSSFGVVVNGKKIVKHQLKNGDKLTFGLINITYKELAENYDIQTNDTQIFDKTIQFYSNEMPEVVKPQQRKYKIATISKKEALKEHIIVPQGILIGRSSNCDVILQDMMVSHRHAKIWQENDTIYIEDHNSKNGVFLEGKKISKNKPVLIKKNQKIGIGSYHLVVVDSTEKVSTSFF